MGERFPIPKNKGEGAYYFFFYDFFLIFYKQVDGSMYGGDSREVTGAGQWCGPKPERDGGARDGEIIIIFKTTGMESEV